MSVIAINNLEEFHRIINGDKPVFIDFWATWCGPCKMISPVFEKLAEISTNEKTGFGFYKVDVDEQEEISQEVGIRAMPTFIAYKNGSKHGEVMGANPPALGQLISQFK